MRLLIVEDEPELLKDLSNGLLAKGYAVDVAADGLSAYQKAVDESYDLILLDLNLPGMSGMEMLEKLWEEGYQHKVLILSANSQLKTKLKSFDLGALDYMTKPFHFQELEARIRLLIHRHFVQQPTVLEYDTLSLDTAAKTAFVQDEPIKLTSKEFSLLEYLLLHRGQLVSQQELIDHVWDESVDAFSNSIRVHLSSLRKKIKSAMGYDPIQTKIGEGYMIT